MKSEDVLEERTLTVPFKRSSKPPPALQRPHIYPAYSPGAPQDIQHPHNQYQKSKAESTVYICKKKHKVAGQRISIFFSRLTLLSVITLFIVDTITFHNLKGQWHG